MTYTLTIVGTEGESGTDAVESQAKTMAAQLPGVTHANLQTGDGQYVDLIAPAEGEAPAPEASGGAEATPGV